MNKINKYKNVSILNSNLNLINKKTYIIIIIFVC